MNAFNKTLKVKTPISVIYMLIVSTSSGWTKMAFTSPESIHSIRSLHVQVAFEVLKIFDFLQVSCFRTGHVQKNAPC